jgi:hypothetical protein
MLASCLHTEGSSVDMVKRDTAAVPFSDNSTTPESIDPATAGTADQDDAMCAVKAPFCERRAYLPPLKAEQIVEPIRLPEDTQARDPMLWIDEISNAEHRLMTEDEAEQFINTHSGELVRIKQKLNAAQLDIEAECNTVYLGSYASQDDAEFDAGRATRQGLSPTIQQGAEGSWVVVLSNEGADTSAKGIEQYLRSAGLANYARLEPSADTLAEKQHLRSRLANLADECALATLILDAYSIGAISPETSRSPGN